MRAVRGGLAYAALCVLLHPLFFVIYRLAVFNTVPRDDYAGFLLWLLGRPGGSFPDSPYCYRILSMVAAAAFYWLPLIPLTNTPAGLAPEYLKATAALSMVAFLAWVATGVLAYVAAAQARLGPAGRVLAGALALALMGYVQFTAIDPLAVMLVAACVAALGRPGLLAGVLAGSVFVNEKVALVMAAWLGLRFVLVRGERWLPVLLAASAVLAYAAAVAVLRLPGNAYQQDVGSFQGTLLANLAAYATGRGLLLNALPLAVLLAVALLGRPVGRFRRADVLVVPVLAGVALVLTQFFQAGRIAMHAAPILVVPAAAAIEAWLAGGARRRG